MSISWGMWSTPRFHKRKNLIFTEQVVWDGWEMRGTVITIVQDHTLKDLKKIAAQLDLTLQEVFLHGGALHTERPEVKSEPKKEQSVQKNSRKTSEKLHTMPKKTKKKQKNQKDKGKRRH